MQKKVTDSPLVQNIVDAADVDIQDFVQKLSIGDIEQLSATVQDKKRIALTDTAIRSYAKYLPLLKDLEDITIMWWNICKKIVFWSLLLKWGC